MLITKEVAVNINPRNKKYFQELGYITNEPVGAKVIVKVNDLKKGSGIYIQCLCDYCLEEGIETIIEKRYIDYIRENNNAIIHKDCCKKCVPLKAKESNMLIYNVENPMKLDNSKEKFISSNLNKYKVEYPMQNEIIKQKQKDTIFKKYGVENISSLETIKDKKKQTTLKNYGVEYYSQTQERNENLKNNNLEKYGVEYYSQTEEYKEKVKNTCLNKYGVPTYSQTEECKNKVKNTSLIKYGVESYMQTEEFKNKSKETLFKKYGVENYVQSDNYKEKVKIISLEKYGVPHYSQNTEIIEKRIATLYKNNNIPTSSQQIAIFNILKDKGYNVELNYPVSKIAMDIMLTINNIKIDIEYDCWYWHKDQQKDRRRDEFAKSQGYKVLRIKSGHKIPKIEQLIESIDKLVNTDRTFTQIILDDWGKGNVIIKEVV